MFHAMLQKLRLLVPDPPSEGRGWCKKDGSRRMPQILETQAPGSVQVSNVNESCVWAECKRISNYKSWVLLSRHYVL